MDFLCFFCSQRPGDLHPCQEKRIRIILFQGIPQFPFLLGILCPVLQELHVLLDMVLVHIHHYIRNQVRNSLNPVPAITVQPDLFYSLKIILFCQHCQQVFPERISPDPVPFHEERSDCPVSFLTLVNPFCNRNQRYCCRLPVPHVHMVFIRKQVQHFRRFFRLLRFSSTFLRRHQPVMHRLRTDRRILSPHCCPV